MALTGRQLSHLVLVRWALAACLAGGSLGAAACAAAPRAEDVNVTWVMEGQTPKVGTTMVAEATVRNADRSPVTGARLEVQGHMSHPGMAPIIAAAVEQGPGVYKVRFEFSMAGDWTLLLRGTLPDGRRVSHQIDVPNVQPPG